MWGTVVGTILLLLCRLSYLSLFLLLLFVSTLSHVSVPLSTSLSLSLSLSISLKVLKLGVLFLLDHLFLIFLPRSFASL